MCIGWQRTLPWQLQKFTRKNVLSGREYCNSYFSVFNRQVIENDVYLVYTVKHFSFQGQISLSAAESCTNKIQFKLEWPLGRLFVDTLVCFLKKIFYFQNYNGTICCIVKFSIQYKQLHCIGFRGFSAWIAIKNTNITITKHTDHSSMQGGWENIIN